MKKALINLSVCALAGLMAVGTSCIAVFAAPARDSASQFTVGESTSDTSASEGIESFSLIKDYDSENPTGTTDPKSKSPADTFEYTITPYAVWNAGYTYSGSGIGAATMITVRNMPLLSAPEGVSSIKDRTLTIHQAVSVDDAKFESTADTANTDDNKVTITLPEYSTVGDYWYKVVETHGKTTGVIYGTNSKATGDSTEDNIYKVTNENADTRALNGNYSRVYYIHVQVTEIGNGHNGTADLAKNVTMHTSAPDPSITNTDSAYNNIVTPTDSDGLFYMPNDGNKVNAIENKYYAGELVIKKTVTGNAGDKTEYFPVTVTFTKPNGTIVNSDIPFTAMLKNGNTYTSTDCVIKGQYYNGAEDSTTIKWSWSNSSNSEATAKATFYVKDGSSVTFSNIPYGINYTVSEKLPENDNYTNTITFDGSKETGVKSKFDNQTLSNDTDATVTNGTAGAASGSISDLNDTITIENKKETTIDIGVLLSNAPYAALLGLAGAAGVVLARRRKNRVEE